MNGLQSFTIAGSDAGLQTNKKPFLLPDKAFPVLENAYVWRDRVVKRYGLELLGRLQRNLGPLAFGSFDGLGVISRNIRAFFSLEASATIVPGSLRIDQGVNQFSDINPITMDLPTGQIFDPAGVPRGTINYITTQVEIDFPIYAGLAVTITFSYYPSLPVMGIWQRELPSINDEQTIWFDTKYAYIFTSGAFQEFISGTTWSGTDHDFFWTTNWRGVTPDIRLFFATNFINDANNPIRYTDGTTWTSFSPYLSRETPPDPTIDIKLYQSRILIPYYGRLLALNTWEGTESGGNAGAKNFFARCRYSQIGDPVGTDAWRSDLFGKGGFIDAPTAEQITGATFFKNTLIVEFEKTTWQLRYVGDYGIPFIWERISSDFGSESTFSSVLFDQGVAMVGDRAIISSNAISADRIDLAIPDLVFNFKNTESGTKRVIGERDFSNELVYWCYTDSQYSATDQKFPNKILVYNYRNNTYSIFRDNVTFFGTFQRDVNITWDSEIVFWNDQEITWDSPANQSLFSSVVSGNQQGFVHIFNSTTAQQSQESLYVSAVDLTTTPIELTIPNHNLVDQEIIYLTGLLFLDNLGAPVSTDLNDTIYLARWIDNDTIGLEFWDTSQNPNQYIPNFSFTPDPSTSTYVGGGLVALFPRLNVETKDFNPYLQSGSQAKFSYIDFLTDATPSGVMTVNLYANTQTGDPSLRANILVGNQQNETYLTSPYYSTPVSDIAWHRFYCTLASQFIRIQMTYDNDLMNQLTTHQQKWVLNAITLWTRPGGKMIF